MPPKTFHRRAEWNLQASPEAFWPFIADTHRLNYDGRNPALRSSVPGGARLRNGYHRLRASIVEFEEEPFEWVRPHLYTSYRRFLRGGIFADIRARTELTALPSGGSHLVYEMWARPASGPGGLLVPLLLHRIFASYQQIIPAYDRAALQPQPSPFALPPGRVQFAPGGRARLDQLGETLLAQSIDPSLVNRLLELLRSADDLTLAGLRPYALADHWKVPRQAALELCLRATRLGLLAFQWEVLCPLCRGAKQRNETLGTLQAQVHCETCNIDFTANFDRSVELLFRPSPAIRPTEFGEFCVGGPQVTPHIVMQQLLRPGDERALTVPLEAGRYRLRALELPGGQALVVSAEGASAARFAACAEGWSSEEIALAPTTTLHLANQSDEEQLLILERMTWSDQAVTAAEVTALQQFRDLFSSEALRPGERLSVGSLTILFTDLRNSTRLYREVGDAVAFGRVMEHFDILKASISAEGGGIVKTIGDAVMAVFVRPVAALRATLAMQEALCHAADGAIPLQLKAGIHCGPCIAVTLNERLDYFGSTVNLAARLEALSADGGVILSESVVQDPEVAGYLAELAPALHLTPFEAEIKGFDGVQMLFRLSA